MSEEKKVEVPAKFKEIVDIISSMSVIDLAELVGILEDKFGVSAATPMMAPTATGANAAADGAPAEQTVFNVELTATGSNKIAVIKVIREITQKGLKEAKDLVEGAPKPVKEGATKEEADELKAKLEAAGAKVELK